jgi:hypothetical protein
MTAVAYVLLGPAPVVQLFFLLTAPGTAVRQTLRGVLPISSISSSSTANGASINTTGTRLQNRRVRTMNFIEPSAASQSAGFFRKAAKTHEPTNPDLADFILIRPQGGTFIENIATRIARMLDRFSIAKNTA